ncbi:MAG: hypothetical protein ACYS47_13265 [Planctomycetota bacterium]
MADTSGEKRGAIAKIKLGALIGAGVILLWFLIVNLFTKCSLSLWPLTKWEGFYIPGTLFIFIFLAIGSGLGFGFCFYWLRRDRLGAAVDMLTETEGPGADAEGEAKTE